METTDTGVICTTWPTLDSDSDSHDDTHLQVDPGNRVCWDIHVKDNVTVPATTYPQIFTATIHVWGDGVTEVDTRTVFFLVPPTIG